MKTIIVILAVIATPFVYWLGNKEGYKEGYRDGYNDGFTNMSIINNSGILKSDSIYKLRNK
jgi:hypothetical protein